jgi:formylglycine-generating enzyme required for sulfatase activity
VVFIADVRWGGLGEHVCKLPTVNLHRRRPRSARTIFRSLSLATLAVGGCASFPQTGGATRTDDLNALRIAKARGIDADRQAAFEQDPIANAWGSFAADHELPQLRLYVGDGEWMNFVYVGPGSYGTTDASGAPRQVRVGHGFWMGRTEVTQRQWRLLTGAAPSRFVGDDQRPVERVSWNDATDACKRISARVGATVRLPTEAEWTFAARAGSSGAWCFGNDPAQLERYAWFEDNASDSPAPVGLKRPNAWGLFDMHGNVREWCSDAFSAEGEAPDGAPRTSNDPNATRVLRGGAFDSSARDVQCSARTESDPAERFPLFGVRLCVDLRPESPEQAKQWAAAQAEREAAALRVRDAFWKAHAHPPAPTVSIRLDGGTTMDFIYVRPGSFRMGSPMTEAGHEDNEDAVDVRVQRGFWMARTEVTQAQWRAVMGTNPSQFTTGPDADRRPADSVRWVDADAFCERVAARIAPMRLPSEAEWEYACRAGSTTAYGFGDDPADLPRHAWFDGNDLDTTYPVGARQPNAWGFHDMHGNVWEWCQDSWHDSYRGRPSDATAWIIGGNPWLRVTRGGSWDDTPSILRSANRNCFSPESKGNVFGFRPVIDAP